MNNNFPLQEWFDLSRKIEKEELENAITQIS